MIAAMIIADPSHGEDPPPPSPPLTKKSTKKSKGKKKNAKGKMMTAP
jgi:hypothetical protein